MRCCTGHALQTYCYTHLCKHEHLATLHASFAIDTESICESVFVLSSKIQFDPQLLPPSHMPVTYGPVKSRKAKADMSQKDTADSVDVGRVCAVCTCSLLVCLLVLLCTGTFKMLIYTVQEKAKLSTVHTVSLNYGEML